MNTEFKGTPGPWEFVPESEEGRYGDGNMGGFRSASGWVCTFGDWRMYYPTEGCPPDPEDARLIAAAPELLEALQKVDELLYDVECYNSIDAQIIEQCQDTIRIAIAKALGQREEDEES